jgi:phospholipid/cholesterol/gamma-HCH transport system substrate-binding protein
MAGTDKPRIPRKDRRGANPVVVGVLLVLGLALGSYLGFTKDIPFTKGFRVKAVFENSTSIRAGSPVRIAGVNVGKVKSVSRFQDTDMAEVEMEITDKGLPIHKDAELKIRPRIFLEGNFFVDLAPGTPGAPTVGDGDTIRVTQTASPVQLDELLTTLQASTRDELQTLLDEFGNALEGPPGDSDKTSPPQDEDVIGETAAQSINDSYDDAGPAFKGASILNEAFLGSEPHDVSRLLAGLQKVTAALGRNETVLQDFVTNFNRTAAIFGDEKDNLSQAIAELPSTLRNANSAFASLNRAFPPTRRFARAILPGVRESAATIDASFPWIEQARQLMAPSELQGVAAELSPAARDLAAGTDAATAFLRQQDLFARCMDRVILPTGDVKIRETGNRAQFDLGVENYKEFWYAMNGLAGESQNFDANGQMVRFQTGGGSQTFQSGVSNATGARSYFTAPAAPLGTRPAWPGKKPPYRPDVDCYKNDLPDLNSARVGGSGAEVANVPGITQTPQGGDAVKNPGPEPRLPQLSELPPNQSSSPPSNANNGASASSSARASSAQQGSLAEELAGRLNPFRSTSAKGAAR